MDVFGIVYIIDNAQQFWSGTDPRSLTCLRPRPRLCTELEDILHIPDDVTLSKLDSTLRRYVSFCAAYHGERFPPPPGLTQGRVPILLYHPEQYLQSPLQLEHACEMILASELFTFHSERMCELLVDDAQSVSLDFPTYPLPSMSVSD